jgi:S1-C subfamily serine protease
MPCCTPGIDLAVLQLDDPSFFDTHPPVARASKLPQIKDPVLAYGFPTGGSSLSITKGIVSRIEFASYNYPVSGLRIQIDAAINPGNSGGPAIAGDKMIGLAFSRLGGDSQNIGYIIPNEEVDLFLKDVAGGHYVGKASMHDDLQTLENPALREYLKLDKSVEGMVVHRPDKSDPSYRRYGHRQPGHGQNRQGPAGEFRLHDSEGRQERQAAPDGGACRQDAED